MRADVNLSIRESGSDTLGTRTEMKNLNSFKAITRAIESEYRRQMELLEEGKQVIQETRRWDDNKEFSYAMRSKEDAQDYRYFPDPDLVPIRLSDEWIKKIRFSLPELRDEKRKRFKSEYNLPDYDIDILTGSRTLADLFEEATAICGQPKKVSNWLMVETLRLLKEREMEPEAIRFSPDNLAKLIQLTEKKTINSSVAREVFEILFYENIDPEEYVETHGLNTVSNEDELQEILRQIIEDNPVSVADYRNGKKKALGFLVGQSMKKTQGKADPSLVSRILVELL